MKHIAIDLYFVRDYVVKGLLQVHHASSHNQLADLLTKALPRVRSTHLQTKISIIDGKPILLMRVKNQSIITLEIIFYQTLLSTKINDKSILLKNLNSNSRF
jgi:hypothetical protein